MDDILLPIKLATSIWKKSDICVTSRHHSNYKVRMEASHGLREKTTTRPNFRILDFTWIRCGRWSSSVHLRTYPDLVIQLWLILSSNIGWSFYLPHNSGYGGKKLSWSHSDKALQQITLIDVTKTWNYSRHGAERSVKHHSTVGLGPSDWLCFEVFTAEPQTTGI